MPELPEVETAVRDLNKTILGRKIEDVWSDARKIVKHPKTFGKFRKIIIGKRIEKVSRKAKNILIEFSSGEILLIHQKMTGHLLVGNWELKNSAWKPVRSGPLDDPMNRFLHLIFWLDDGRMLALSDLRKFAKVLLMDSVKLFQIPELANLGPDALDKSFTGDKLKQILKLEKGKIKQVLMDQEVISGIGNIYSDEILWAARIHPSRKACGLDSKEVGLIYASMVEILNKAIKLKGDSMSDYRLITGEKGSFQDVQNVYQREGKSCLRKDGGIILRIKIGGRSAHFCPKCQKMKLRGLTPAVSLRGLSPSGSKTSPFSAERNPPKQKIGIHSRSYGRGFLRRRIKL